MKYLKSLLFLGLLWLAVGAQAQVGFDSYYSTRTIVITPPKLQAGNVAWSNNPVDIHGAVGVAKVDILMLTNGAAGASTITLYGSTDLTNWTALTSCSVVSNTTSIIYTNLYYANGANNLTVTNTMLLPGVSTSGSPAWSAGLDSTYMIPYPMTNSAILAANAGGSFEVGFVAMDQPRYLSLSYSGAATSTNFYSAVLTIRKAQ